MPEILKSNQRLDWICRILIVIDMYVILSGYLSWFQVKRQLVSPLIPQSTVYTIFREGGEASFKAALIAGVLFLAGILLYTFQKKIAAIILFATAILLFLGRYQLFL